MTLKTHSHQNKILTSTLTLEYKEHSALLWKTLEMGGSSSLLMIFMQQKSLSPRMQGKRTMYSLVYVIMLFSYFFVFLLCSSGFSMQGEQWSLSVMAIVFLLKVIPLKILSLCFSQHYYWALSHLVHIQSYLEMVSWSVFHFIRLCKPHENVDA